jgi:hypothetical protein
VKPERVLAAGEDVLGDVGGEQQARPLGAHLLDPGLAALAEGRVADREDLVEDEQSRTPVSDDTEGEPQFHPVAVGAHRFAGEVLELREREHLGDRGACLPP